MSNRHWFGFAAVPQRRAVGILRITLFLPVLLFSGEGLPSEGIEATIQRCEQCHGPRGVSERSDVPSIAGREERYIVEAMDEFYFYERHCPTRQIRREKGEHTLSDDMCTVASDLADEEIAALARYFSAQPRPE